LTHTTPTDLSTVSGSPLGGSSVGTADALLSPSKPERKSRTWRTPALFRGHRILLWVVGLVVVLVSLPLLQSIALKQNEMDALRALRLLGGSLQGSTVHAADGQPASQLAALVSVDTDLGRRLPDTRISADGRLMIHHGYLFELVPTGSGKLGVRAWPLAHGETGLGAFLWDGSGQILGHPNQEAHWSGPESAPEWPGAEIQAPAAWRPVELAPSRQSSGS
jgi:hypothetical protein